MCCGKSNIDPQIIAQHYFDEVRAIEGCVVIRLQVNINSQ